MMKLLLLVPLMALCCTTGQSAMGENSCRNNTFKYFAFGSNLLEKRIHINNPTAKRAGAAFIVGYRLDFNYFSKRWNGYAATIVPDEGKTVWGALWDVDKCDEQSLDDQEGTNLGIYKAVMVKAVLQNLTEVESKSYMLCSLPTNNNISERPPSKTYLDTIIAGAKETGLPQFYIDQLEMIPHNNYTGDPNHGSNE